MAWNRGAAVVSTDIETGFRFDAAGTRIERLMNLEPSLGGSFGSSTNAFIG